MALDITSNIGCCRLSYYIVYLHSECCLEIFKTFQKQVLGLGVRNSKNTQTWMERTHTTTTNACTLLSCQQWSLETLLMRRSTLPQTCIQPENEHYIKQQKKHEICFSGNRCFRPRDGSHWFGPKFRCIFCNIYVSGTPTCIRIGPKSILGHPFPQNNLNICSTFTGN